MIPFNRPPYTGNEDQYVLDSIRSDKISADGGIYTLRIRNIESLFSFKKSIGVEAKLNAIERNPFALEKHDCIPIYRDWETWYQLFDFDSFIFCFFLSHHLIKLIIC